LASQGGRAIARSSTLVDKRQPRETVLVAWERLLQQDLIGWTGQEKADQDLRMEYRLARLLVSKEDAEWALRAHPDSNDELRRWHQREVSLN
jgi:hypothetical protein